jgi:diguanylate cyclase (GGDEF)-like protein/PAS domain S-box-containing protein
VLKGLFSLHSIAHIAALGFAALALANFSLAQELPAQGRAGEPAGGGQAAPPQTRAEAAAGEAILAPNAAPPDIFQEAYDSAVDIASGEAVIDMSSALEETRVTDPAAPGAAWFTVYVQNTGDRLGARVLQAVDPPAAGLSLTPPIRRPTLLEVAGSDGAVIIERAEAFGSNTFRFILPASHESALALHFEGVGPTPTLLAWTESAALHFDGVGPTPTLLAWTESALIAHNRRISLLVGTIGGLFAAAMAFAGGAAAFGGRPFVKWSALFLGALFIAFLTSARLFDETWLTYFGGPYGLFALALSFALAAGSRVVDHVASFEAFWSPARRWANLFAIAMIALGLAAWFGVSGAGLSIRILTVVGAAAAAGYLTHCGRLGVAGARRVAPAVTIFALVTAAAAFRATGLMGTGVIAHSVIAGFSAVGAVLIALTSAVASSEPTVARLRSMRRAHLKDDVQATTTDEIIAGSREHAAVVASHQGIFDLDLDSNLLALSAEAARILGIGERATELPHKVWLRYLPPDDRDVYLQALATYRNKPNLAYRIEFRVKRQDGNVEWYELRATMFGQASEPGRCLGLIANVNARKEAEIYRTSPQLDGLTGLGNRLALFELLEGAGDQLGKLALSILDLDRFKAVDSSVGAEGADTLLRQVASRIEKKIGQKAKIFRVGGDMFAVVTPKPPKLPSLGDRILESMAQPFLVANRELFLPVSVGIASGDMAEDAQDFVSKAELAMIQAKREGGARVCIYSDDFAVAASSSAGDPITLDTNLRRALERSELEIHYQPVMRVSNGSIAGFEALLRWKHPEHGVIEPDEFIPYAERVGLIVPLGQLALERASEDLARWHQFFPLDPPLFVSVNVSWRQIERREFANELKIFLARSNVPKDALKLEITESAVMENEKKAGAALKKLRALGVGLAIDDFGTGQSSLSQLRRLPFDLVKVDKSFLAIGEKTEAILSSIVKLAHDLGLEVVVEGVELESDATRLRDLSCEYAQGFFFGAPLPAADVPNFIAMTYSRKS